MKKLALLPVFLLLLMSSVMAQSVLNVAMADNRACSIILDGRSMNTAATHHIANLSEGPHYLQVYADLPTATANRPMEMIYNGTINIPAYAELWALVDVRNGFYIQHQNPIARLDYQEPCLMPVSEPQFCQIKKAISNQWFDNSKDMVARQAFSSYYVSSAQVLDVLQLFSFENNKLAMAEFLYAKCVDPQNYYMVNNAFSFSSTVSSLIAYTNCHPNTLAMHGGAHHDSYDHGDNSAWNHGHYGDDHQGNNGAWNHGHYGDYDRGYHLQAMPADAFARAKASIYNQSFENSKAAVARQILNSNYLSSGQIVEMIALFSFDNTKLEIAKAAYGKCIDPQNYYQVASAFDFSSSSNDLMAYLGTQH
jgi:hypothetical protein